MARGSGNRRKHEATGAGEAARRYIAENPQELALQVGVHMVVSMADRFPRRRIARQIPLWRTLNAALTMPSEQAAGEMLGVLVAARSDLESQPDDPESRCLAGMCLLALCRDAEAHRELECVRKSRGRPWSRFSQALLRLPCRDRSVAPTERWGIVLIHDF